MCPTYVPDLSRVPTIREYEEKLRYMKWQATKQPDLENVLTLTIMITGARVSEVLALRTIDIDFERKRLSVITLTKRAGNKRPIRLVPVPAWYLPIIQTYIVRNAISYKLFPIKRKYAWLIVKRKTGYHPHAFRHAVAMYLLYKGVDPETVRRILGFSDWKLIEYYVRAVRTDIEKTPLEDIY